MLNSVLNSLLDCEANFGNLLKDMVGPWGLEPQTSTVSKKFQIYYLFMPVCNSMHSMPCTLLNKDAYDPI